MTTPELKPCPHCGDFCVEYDAVDDRVYCCDCGTSGPHYCDGEEAAAEAWNALPRPLRWTKELPTENGWYIYQERRNRRLCCVIDGKVTGFAFGLCKVEDLHGEWAGPIPEPQEQP